ncbi:MAG: SUMF1/EgtB/PvdO family nonheme iron enzyme [Candidatus Hydrogenedentes bacterium]|nr:SUMF1/EgtB/PvdO family nonheme iron enzyme [Candidatus Hydrogenedentota bacterium]
MSKFGSFKAAVAAVILVVTSCGGENEPKTATLTINSEPSGASVSLSGIKKGETPITLDGLWPGPYVVRVMKEGYDTFTRSMELAAGDVRTVTARLQRETAYAVINSEPQGANCYHEDGTLLGVTPIHGYVPRGSYTMRFEKKNYQEVYIKVNIKANTTTEIRAKLKPLMASIKVTSKPSHASVLIDEVDVHRMTPTTIEIKPGFHTVGIYMKGFNREERDLHIDPNAAVSVHFDLMPGDVPARMAKIEAGPFIMGSDKESPDEQPRREVNLDTFFIDKFEVTNIRYQRFDPAFKFPPELANHPVVNVTWQDAAAYAEWAGKRLPTEAEWEKAARGVDGQIYPWGNDPPAPELCNVADFGLTMLKSVGLGARVRGRSPYGCYDMAGNVWEWCNDWYAAYPGSKISVGNQQVRVIRGGAYTQTSYHARCSNRDYERPNVGRPDIGFRCAMSPESATSD